MKFLASFVFIGFLSRCGRPALHKPPSPSPAPGQFGSSGGSMFSGVDPSMSCDASAGETNCSADLEDKGYVTAIANRETFGLPFYGCPQGYQPVEIDYCVHAWVDFACLETRAGRPRCIWGHGTYSTYDEYLPHGCVASAQSEETTGWNPIFNTATTWKESTFNDHIQYRQLCRPMSFATATTTGTTDTTTGTTTTATTTILDLTGTYTVVQVKTGRFMDAHTSASEDYSVVTRGEQGDDSQLWTFTRMGDGSYTIQQKKNSRYLDAWLEYTADWDAVTRGVQENDSQKWIVTVTDTDNHVRIQQKHNLRFLDAWENSNGHRVVTREQQLDDSQTWKLEKV